MKPSRNQGYFTLKVLLQLVAAGKCCRPGINHTALVRTGEVVDIIILFNQEIEKAILAANIGVTPQNDGEIIRLVLPPLTEERRRDLVKTVKNYGEHTKVSIRNIRRDALHHIKELLKEGKLRQEMMK